MNQSKQKNQYKTFLRLLREKDLLYDLKRKQPYKDVTPFHHGWEVSVVVKSYNPKYEGLEQALLIGYHTKSVYNKDHVKKIRSGIISYRIRDKIFSYIPDKKRIKETDFDEIPFDLKKYFEKCFDEKNKKEYFLFKDFSKQTKLKVKAQIYTRVQEVNPEIEKRLAEIGEIFEQNNFWTKYYGKHKRDIVTKERLDGKRQLKKFLLNLTDDINNQKHKFGWT
jgi:hypothetical protein